MSSSNRHWPSMFKSKPSHHQWQNHDLISSHRTTPYTPAGGGNCEERTPEPKPRWNPRPEQIRILEAIFNSGMVNPPRDEIRKIRGQLQEYGQVGDANVFYWFQNRKSRSKHKQRQLQNPNKSSSSSSSSSNKSSSSDKSAAITNSPTASVNQPFFQNVVFPVSDQSLQDTCPSLMLMSQCPSKRSYAHEQQLLLPEPSYPTPSFSLPSPTFQGVTKSTVFINDVCFEVGSGPFNVREAFGDDAVLIDSTGLAVAMDGWGVTVQPLRHGGFYYLIRPFSSTAPPTHHDTTTIDLI